MPKLTVITPCYNAEKYIGQTIASVQNQTFTDWEYLIVDDGSTDGSSALVAEQAARDPRLRLIPQINQGKCAACNRAIEMARGEYVAILDHDDLYEPRNLECKVAYLDAHPKAGMVYSDTDAIDGSGKPLPQTEAQGRTRYAVGPDGRRVPVAQDDPHLFPYLVVDNCIPMLTHVMRQSAAQEVGAFDAACWPYDDWDFWLRFSRRFEMHRLPDALTLYRRHDSNASRDGARMAQGRHAVYAKLQADATLTSEERRHLNNALRADALFHAQCCRGWGGDALRAKNYAAAARYFLRAARLQASSRNLLV